MKKLIIVVLCLCFVNVVYAQDVCKYRINGICTTDDIGGVKVFLLSSIDQQIAVLTALLSAPVGTPDYSTIPGFLTPELVQQGYHNYLQMQQLEMQRQQMLLQTLLQARAMQGGSGQRLKFENSNNFTVSVIFEVQSSNGAKKTGTIVLEAMGTKETTGTFVDTKYVNTITRRY